MEAIDIKVCELKFSNHLKVLKPLLFITFGVICILLFFGHRDGFSSSLLGFFVIFFALNALPVLYFHVEYYLFSKNKSITIDSVGRKIIQTHRNHKTEYKVEDITEIKVYLFPNMYSGRIQIAPFEIYHYGLISTKNGTNIILTCLLTKDVLKIMSSIKGVHVEKRKAVPSILLNRWLANYQKKFN